MYELGERLANEPFTATVAAINLLESCGSPTAVELITEYPQFSAERWKQTCDDLVSAGVDLESCGMVLSLYPDVLDYHIPALIDTKTADWLNNIAKALHKLKIDNPEAYYGQFIVSDVTKFEHVQQFGRRIFELQHEHPECDVPALIVSHPKLIAETKSFKDELVLENLGLFAEAYGAGLDFAGFEPAQLNRFLARAKTLDSSQPDFRDALVYLHERIAREAVLRLAARLGIREAYADDVILGVIKRLGKSAPAWAGPRLQALYEALDKNAERLEIAIQSCPEYLTERYGYTALVSAGVLRSDDIRPLRHRTHDITKHYKVAERQFIRRNARANQTSQAARKQHQEAVEQAFASADFEFTTQSLPKILSQHPQLITVSSRQIKTRILALNTVLGPQVARLAIEDNVEFLYVPKPAIVLGSMRLSDAQKTEFSYELRRKVLTEEHREAVQRANAALLAEYVQRPELQTRGAAIDSIFAQYGVAVSFEAVVFKCPRAIEYRPELVESRLGALVDLFGKYRATVLINQSPAYLGSQQPIPALGTSISPTEAKTLRRHIRRLNDKRSLAKMKLAS